MEAPYLLGISCYYHDSAAALLKNGIPIAAAQEERFTRVKHDAGFPHNAIRYCLEAAGIEPEALSGVVYYEKPLLKFDRLLETFFSFAPKGFSLFSKAMPVWIKQKLMLKSTLRRELSITLNTKKIPALYFCQHHLSHAASAYYPSPFKDAAILCLDGVGEWATTSAWLGENTNISPLWQIDFPHSLGLFYSAITQYLGFKVNSGEYKVMGLAPYGSPKYTNLFLNHLIDVKNDGSFRLNLRYFDYCTQLSMVGDNLCQLLGNPIRLPSDPLTSFHMDIAASLQVVTEQVVLKLAANLQKSTRARHLCLAGGVALNCVANGKLQNSGMFDKIWIQPAAGDAGGALGAALYAWHQQSNTTKAHTDIMQGSYLGPQFPTPTAQLNQWGIEYLTFGKDLFTHVATRLARGEVIGWFQGKMEFGPRALGNRSILADPRALDMQRKLNLKIKFRESFRPFAPAVLEEDAATYFELTDSSPYMLMTTGIHPQWRLQEHPNQALTGLEKLATPRSTLPAITHVDYSARVQTVSSSTNPKFHSLLHAFKQQTGCPVLINTSFNVRGEPVVCTPLEAIRCFTYTDMDCLVINNHVIDKREKPKLKRVFGNAPTFAED